MARIPVTLAGQGVFIDPDDAGELTDLLVDAAWVIGHLASHPPAEDACARTPCRQGSCAELAMDLRLAATALDEAATAGHDNAYIGAQVRTTAGPDAKRRQHAADNKHSGERK